MEIEAMSTRWVGECPLENACLDQLCAHMHIIHTSILRVPLNYKIQARKRNSSNKSCSNNYRFTKMSSSVKQVGFLPTKLEAPYLQGQGKIYRTTLLIGSVKKDTAFLTKTAFRRYNNV
ncbi:MAG: hypothetical protein ACTSRR_09765 [Candidatus Heimdallarchaeaceae archaeon]